MYVKHSLDYSLTLLFNVTCPMTAVLKSFKDFYLTIHRQYARQRLSNNKLPITVTVTEPLN